MFPDQMTSVLGKRWTLSQLTRAVTQKIGALGKESESEDIDSLFEQGISALESGTLEQAEGLLLEVIRLQPDLLQAHIALVDLYIWKQQWPQAIHHYSRVQQLSLDPGDDLGQYLLARAEQMLATSDPSRAIAYLTHGMTCPELTVDQRIRAHFLLGLGFESTGDWDAALESLQRVLELSPDQVEAHHRRGVIFRAKGIYDLSIQACSSALNHNFYHPQIHHELGLACFRKGDLSRAIQAFQTALRLTDEPEADWYASLGIALIQAGNLADAGISLTKALGREITCLRAHYGMALMLTEHGDRDEARSRFMSILRQDPDFLSAKAGIGMTYLADKQVRESGRKFLRPAQLEAAKTCFDSVLEQDPTVAEAHFGLGEVLRLQRRLRDAIRSYERALELNGSLTMAHYKLGKTFAVSARIEEAVHHVAKAHQMNPNHPEIATYLQRLRERQDMVFFHTGITFHTETQIKEISPQTLETCR